MKKFLLFTLLFSATALWSADGLEVGGVGAKGLDLKETLDPEAKNDSQENNEQQMMEQDNTDSTNQEGTTKKSSWFWNRLAKKSTPTVIEGDNSSTSSNVANVGQSAEEVAKTIRVKAFRGLDLDREKAKSVVREGKRKEIDKTIDLTGSEKGASNDREKAKNAFEEKLNRMSDPDLLKEYVKYTSKEGKMMSAEAENLIENVPTEEPIEEGQERAASRPEYNVIRDKKNEYKVRDKEFDRFYRKNKRRLQFTKTGESITPVFEDVEKAREKRKNNKLRERESYLSSRVANTSSREWPMLKRRYEKKLENFYNNNPELRDPVSYYTVESQENLEPDPYEED